MLCGRMSFRAFKLHGIRFAVTCCSKKYMILKSVELVPENVTLCFHLPSSRWFTSQSGSGRGSSKKANDIKKESSPSKTDVLEALSQSASKQNTTASTSDLEGDESKVPFIPSVIRHAIPSLFVRDSSCTTRTDCIPVDSYSEIDNHKPMSRALQFVYFELKNEFLYGFTAVDAFKKLLESTERKKSIFDRHANATHELLGLVKKQIQADEDICFKDFLFYNFIVKDFPEWLFTVSHTKFELSMKNKKYTLIELLDFAKQLKALKIGFFEKVKVKREQLELLLRSIWNHILTHEDLNTSSVLASLYKEAPVNNNLILSKLESALLNSISKLDLENVFVLLNLPKTSNCSKRLSAITVWILSTLEDRTVNDLENLMSGYLRYNHVCSEIFGIFEEIVNIMNSKNSLTPKLMCQMISYCKKGLYFHDWLLNKACSHYMDNTEHYTSENLHALLEVIGVLNYLPESQGVFFTKVEEHLIGNFYNIEVSMLLDMFVFLIYLDKTAVNFLPYIFTPDMISCVHEFTGEKQKRAEENLHLIKNAFKRHSQEPMEIPFNIKNTPCLLDPNNIMVYDTLVNVLRGHRRVKLGRRPTFKGDSYFLMNYTDLAAWANVQIRETSNKFAILTVTENSYCENDESKMLGYEAANIRILTGIGVTVAQIHYSKIKKLRKNNQLSAFLTSLLMQQVLQTADLLKQNLLEESDMSDLIYADILKKR